MTEIPERPDPLAPETVQAFVVAAHGDIDRVRELLAVEPRLVNACWDWGGGDWETGLGGAAHMGRRDIALLLLEHGARLDAFAVAMLGYVDVLRGLLEAFPELRGVRGPHGISLIDHAKAGGEDALEVVRLLEGHAVGGTAMIYEVFRQERKGQAFQHAGSFEAPDRAFAEIYARDFYGRRNESETLWLVQRDAIAELGEFVDELERNYHRVDGYSLKAKLREARERAGTLESSAAGEA